MENNQQNIRNTSKKEFSMKEYLAKKKQPQNQDENVLQNQNILRKSFIQNKI